jgi:perosamine synthetase
MAWAQSAGLKVIHDCAESLTSSWLGSPTGAQAHIRTYSFFANKLITSGEGGAVATRDPSLLARMKLLRGQGMSETIRYWFERPGYNFRMSSMQAALVVSQLERLDGIEDQRNELFRTYDEILGGISSRPKAPTEAYYSPWMYTTLLSDSLEPRSLAEALANKGVETRPVFYPLDQMPAFARYKSKTDSPVAQRINHLGVSLPTWTGWSDSQLSQLTEIIEMSINELR